MLQCLVAAERLCFECERDLERQSAIKWEASILVARLPHHADLTQEKRLRDRHLAHIPR